MTDELLPRLRARTADDRRVIRSVTLRTTGIAESQLPDLLGEHADGFGAISLAYLPGQEGVDLRLTVRDARPEDADRTLVDSRRHAEAATWPALVCGRPDRPGRRCDRDLPSDWENDIAVAESCTGGMLATRLTSVSGSSHAFLGGVVAYDNAVKVEQLGVDAALIDRTGAVSEEVARAMAAGVRALMHTEIGVGITGVAGPEGGTPEKPVGLVWIAVDVERTRHRPRGRFIGDRAEIRFRATQTALNMIRRELAGID